MTTKQREYTQKQLSDSRRKLSRATAWRRSNPTAWAYMVKRARQIVANGERPSARGLIEDVRQKSFVDASGGDGQRVNNDFTPIVGRWLLAECPDLRGHIKLRRCIFDDLMGRS